MSLPPAPTLLDLSGRRLLVSEEALKSEVGHFYEYNRSVIEIAAQYGANGVVAVHKNANSLVCGGLPARPVYAMTSWGTINTERNPLKRHLGTVRHNLRVYRTMSKLLDEVGPVDVLFAPTVTIHHLLGFRLLAARRLGRDVQRMVLLTRNTIASYETGSTVPKFKRNAEVFSRLVRNFEKTYDRDVFTFATDSERLADEYEALSGVRPVVFPSPRCAPPERSALRRTDSMTFASLGPARFEKGIDILQRAVAKLLSNADTPNNARIVVQWNQEVLDDAGGIVSPDPKLMAHPDVRFITEEMTSDAYNSELYGADCIVLPYRRDSYYARISGVAVEAVTAGIPIIYTQNTWCEDLVTKSGAGIGVPDGDYVALAEAMAKMTREAEHYRAMARQAAQAARDMHSSETFARLLFGVKGAR
jgi:glycosyltransferase involved in cell wall biosynthesis